MAERVKVRLSTFSSMFHCYSNSFCTCGGKWVAGKKKSKSKSESERSDWERERGNLARLFLLVRFYQSSSLPTKDPWGSEQSRSPKRKNEQLQNMFLHTPHPRDAIRSSSGTHRQREPPLYSQYVHDCPPQDPLHTNKRIMVAQKYPWRVTDQQKGFNPYCA